MCVCMYVCVCMCACAFCVCARLCVSLLAFQFLDQCTGLHETWYERYTV
jgi:hypothetical protein